jgi:glycosyltransferase involved in cell wall biosynthesis
MAMHNHARHLPEAIETLLGQTEPDFAVVLLDDGSSDDSVAIAESYAQRDSRVHIERNPARQGMIASWRRAADLAAERHPEAQYFAWSSDHDAWHPRWLEVLSAELDAHPEAVLAYPRSLRIEDDGEIARPNPPWSFDTAGVADPADRLEAFARRGAAGDMIYGLFRREALEHAEFRPVVGPDKLMLAELALAGEFRQAAEILWYRRYAHKVTTRRQRKAFFPDEVPASGRLPWPVSHGLTLRQTLQNGSPAAAQIEPARAKQLVREYVLFAYRRRWRKRLLRPLGTVRRIARIPRRVARFPVKMLGLAGAAYDRRKQARAER